MKINQIDEKSLDENKAHNSQKSTTGIYPISQIKTRCFKEIGQKTQK